MTISQPRTGLKSNSVRTPGLIAQSLGADEPQLSAIVVAASVALFAGGSTPAVLVIAAIGIGGFLYLVAKFSGIVGDAGGLYTIATEGLGRRVGAVTGWFMVYGLMLIVPSLFIAAGFLAQAFFAATTPTVGLLSGQWIGWAILFTIVGLLIVVRGVEHLRTASSRDDLCWHVGDPDLRHCNTGPGWSRGHCVGVATAMEDHRDSGDRDAGPALGLAVYTFGGLEGSEYLAEEAEAPTRTVPRAVLSPARSPASSSS